MLPPILLKLNLCPSAISIELGKELPYTADVPVKGRKKKVSCVPPVFGGIYDGAISNQPNVFKSLLMKETNPVKTNL